MQKISMQYITKVLVAAAFLIMVVVFFSGCRSDKLVDLNNKETDALVESIKGNFAEEGWTYTGYEVLESDKENDTMTVLLSYDVEGQPKDILQNIAAEKPDDDSFDESIYDKAENINVKVTAKLSVYDKENDTIGSSVESVQWFVGDTEADAWIREQIQTAK